MNEKSLRLIMGVWLFVSIPALIFYDYTAVSALLGATSDRAGQLVFKGTSPTGEETVVYPFTYAAAALSVVGVTFYIYKAERRWWALLVGLVVARATTAGIIELYELVFVGLGQTVWSGDVWGRYYGNDLPTHMWTVVGLTWIFAAAPWWRRKNLRASSICFGAFLATMLTWLSIGYPPVESGNPIAYVLNAASRLLSQTTNVLLVRR